MAPVRGRTKFWLLFGLSVVAGLVYLNVASGNAPAPESSPTQIDPPTFYYGGMPILQRGPGNRKGPSQDLPFNFAEFVEFFSPSASMQQPISVVDVDTVCIFDSTGVKRHWDALLRLDTYAVFTAFHVGDAAPVDHADRRRLRTFSATTVLALQPLIRNTMRRETGMSHCTVLAFIAGAPFESSLGDELHHAWSAMHASVVINVSGTDGSIFVRERNRRLIDARYNPGLAATITDFADGGWVRSGFGSTSIDGALQSLLQHTLVSNTTKAAISLTTEGDASVKALAMLSESGNISSICILAQQPYPVAMLKRHPTASFTFMQGCNSRFITDQDEIGNVMKAYWCEDPHPLHHGERTRFECSSKEFMHTEPHCDVIVVDSANATTEQLGGYFETSKNLLDSRHSFSVLILLGAQSSWMRWLANLHVVAWFEGRLAILQSSAPLTPRNRATRPLTAKSVPATSFPLEKSSTCLPMARNALSEGPAYDEENRWHMSTGVRQEMTVHPRHEIPLELLGSGKHRLNVRNYFDSWAWAKCSRHVTIREPVLMAVHNGGYAQYGFMATRRTFEVIDISSGVMTSARWWGGQPHLPNIGSILHTLIDLCALFSHRPTAMLPPSPTKRYFWAAGTHSQGFNSHGQQELLNLFARYWAVCRMDYDCVRNTPMIFANLTGTPAFHRNVNFFLEVMPDIPVVWMPESSVVGAPDGSEMIVVLPEMYPDHMPCRSAFVSRVLWPGVQMYFERRGQSPPTFERIVLMKVPRASSNSPDRSFNVTAAFRDKLKRLGFTWIDDDSPKAERTWYINHATTVITTFGGSASTVHELFAGEGRAARQLRIIILQHTSYDHEVTHRWMIAPGTTSCVEPKNVVREHTHNTVSKHVRVDDNDLDRLTDEDLSDKF